MSDKAILVNRQPVLVDDISIWGRAFESADRNVGKTDVGDVHVSTVFIGLDHSFGRGKSLWFETMIFGGEHDGYTDRYATWEEAEAGHAKAVAMVQP